jgi:hypothetical protein
MSVLLTPDGKIKKGYHLLVQEEDGSITVGIDFSHAGGNVEPVLKMDGKSFARDAVVPLPLPHANAFCSLRRYTPT